MEGFRPQSQVPTPNMTQKDIPGKWHPKWHVRRHDLYTTTEKALRGGETKTKRKGEGQRNEGAGRRLQFLPLLFLSSFLCLMF